MFHNSPATVSGVLGYTQSAVSMGNSHNNIQMHMCKVQMKCAAYSINDTNQSNSISAIYFVQECWKL